MGAGSRGFDAGKKINGRKRHIAVDVNGSLLAVVVTAANVGDRMGAKLLVIALLNICTRLKLIWADSGYDGAPLTGWIASVAGATLQIIKTHRTARVSGPAAQVGGRTQLRVAAAIPAAGPGLRTAHRASRGHGVLGHRAAHDPEISPAP